MIHHQFQELIHLLLKIFMKNKKLSASIATAAMALTTSISAQNITRLSVSPTPVDKNIPVSLQIEFSNTGARAWCGLDVSWGNGSVSDIRVGEDNRKEDCNQGKEGRQERHRASQKRR